MAEKVGKVGPMVWDHEIDASLIDSVFQQTGCKVSWRKRPQYGAGKKLTITGPEKKLQDAMGLVIELARKRSASDVTVERPADHSARLDWSQQNLKEFGARPGKRRGEEQQQQRSSRPGRSTTGSSSRGSSSRPGRSTTGSSSISSSSRPGRSTSGSRRPGQTRREGPQRRRRRGGAKLRQGQPRRRRTRGGRTRGERLRKGKPRRRRRKS